MKAIELFAGVGGFRIGLERAGHSVVWANEWDRYACDVYDYNFKHEDKIDRRDITTIPAGDIPAHDIIVGGFPCQAFSVAGKRRGFDETRGTLFFDIMRIAHYHRTPYLLLENVKGLLSHDAGRTFEVILETLDELGYDVQWQVLNSKNFGVPQNRERVYIVGHLRGQPRPEVFPFAGTDAQDIISSRTYHQKDRFYSPDGVAPTLDGGRGGQRQSPKIISGSPSYDEDGKRHMDYQLSDEAPTIRATQYKSGDNQPKVIQDVRGLDKKQNGRGYKTTDEAYTVDTLGTQGVLAVDTKQPGDPRFTKDSPTLQANGWKEPVKVSDGARIRRLTPIECERLQAFPDNWTKYGLKPDGSVYEESDTQRYKMCGNAVTVNVVEAVTQALSTAQSTKEGTTDGGNYRRIFNTLTKELRVRG